jgi:predicted nucleic acid-binding protein
MLDTSFLIAALSKNAAKRREHAEEAMAVLFAQAQKRQTDVLIAATVEAELAVKDDDVPWLDFFEPIAFDTMAAKWLRRIRQRKPTGMIRGYWEYDAITLACAIAGGAEAIVTDDADYAAMIEHANAVASPPLPVRAMWPEEVTMGDLGLLFALERRENGRLTCERVKAGARLLMQRGGAFTWSAEPDFFRRRRAQTTVLDKPEVPAAT